MNPHRNSFVALVTTCCITLALSGNLLAVDNLYVPIAGGNWSTSGNWSLGHPPTSTNDAFIEVSGNSHKAVYFDVSSAGMGNLTIDGSAAGYYGALWHLQDSILVEDEFIGIDGPGWHWMEGDSLLWSLGWLYVGYQDPGPGHFYMNNTSNGVLVNEDTYVGYSGPGDFDHLNGAHVCGHLFVGQNGPATYWLKGPEATSQLNPEWYIVVGNGDVGLFEQTGGTVVNDSSSFMAIGLNPGGEGTYLMKGGALNTDHISIGFSGNGYFTQSGGTVTTTGDISIGVTGNNTMRAWYKLNQADGTATLNVGDDLNVGITDLAKYEQTGGTATVTDNLEIWKGSTGGDYSYVYMGTSAGTLEVNGEAINHSGYFDQDGGVFTTPTFTNDSTYGFNLDNNADFRATTVDHNAGTLYMWRNALVRGEYAGGGLYFMCNFTNDANVQMGNASFNGGTFVGHMTNNGSFNYTQGDFSAGTLTNNGTLNINAPFACKRLVQNAYSYTVPAGCPITASGTGYASAFENNANLTIPNGCSITVVAAPLVNNDNLFAGGTVNGDVENYDYLLPATGAATDEFYIDGDFTQASPGLLRVRLGGNAPISQFDRLRVTGHATLGGTLQVLLINGFTPALGDSFRVVVCSGGRTGQFTQESLPALPSGLEWEVNYTSTLVQLDVVESTPADCPGDVDGDNDVDLTDLAILLSDFDCTSSCVGDVDGDDDTDLTDLAVLLSNFDATCN